MKAAVLDTSVVFKWFHREGEDDVDAALLLRDAYLNGILSLSVPSLLFYEFSNALRFRTDLDPGESAAAVRSLWSLGLDVHPVDAALSDAMMRLAYDNGITIYDAAFAALSGRLGVTLVTADSSLQAKIGGRQPVLLLAETAA